MPNEFVAKNGLIAQSNSVVSGSLVVTNGITGSLFGTSSQALSASYTATSSFGLNAISASYAFTASSATNAFQAVSTSFATTATTATAVVATVAGTNSTELVRGNMADNDQFRILVGGTATNAGFAEIATADDGTEPIHVRQYSGVFASLVRTATLLDGSGNTSFPGTVSAAFSGNLTGTASFASNYLGSGSISTRVTNLETASANLTTASGSFSTRVTNTETTASNLVAASASFSTRITSDSSSFSSRVSSIEATTASLQVASGSFSTRVTQIERTYATTGSNIYTGSQNILGAITASAALINGTITAQTLVVTTVSSSVVFSSGSNIFGNSTANTQTMTGSLNVSGSATIFGRVTATDLTGSLFGTASQATSASYAYTASSAILASASLIATSASYAFTASSAISTSIAQTASFVNLLRQTLAVSGAINLSPTNDPNLSGTNLTSSFLFQSSSNNSLGSDLYIRQNGNLVKWKWIEGQLGTGLLYGGVVTYSGSLVYVSSGSGIIVDYNANTGSEISPTVDYVTWNAITASITNITSSQVTYLYIDNNGSLVQQKTQFTSEQYQQYIPLGAVGHFNYTSSQAFGGAITTAYGQQPQVNNFIDAFGPLKLSGYILNGQTSSLSLSIGSGTSFVHGGFYEQNQNSPSTLVSNSAITASIVRCNTSGSQTVFNLNAGNFYTTVDPTKWDNNGILDTVNSNNWTIQRVFSYAPTNTLYIYYGQSEYTTFTNALQFLASDPFVEGLATQPFTTFVAYLIMKGGTTNITNTTENRILQAGLYRSTVGGSSGGAATVTTLEDLADVTITSPVTGQALIYNAGTWINGLPRSSSYAYTASSATNAFQAISSSYAYTASSAILASASLIATSASYALNATNAVNSTNSNTASFVLPLSQSVIITGSLLVTGSIRTDANLRGGTVTFGTELSSNGGEIRAGQAAFRFGNNIPIQWSQTTDGNGTKDLGIRRNTTGSLEIYDGITADGAVANRRDLIVRNITGSNAFFSSSLVVSGSSSVTGSLNVSQGITGSLFGTASQAVSSSYALTASFALNGGGGVSFPYTGSAQITGSLGVTGSFSVSANQGSSVFSSNADTLVITGSLIITGSGAAITGSLNVSNGITGSLFGTASQAITASYALTASYVASIAGLSTSQIATGSVSASVNTTGNVFTIVSGSNTLMVLNSSGSLGLGVTPTNTWDRVAFEIGVAGAAITRDTRDLLLMSNTIRTSGGYVYAATAGASRFEIGVSSFRWLIAPSGTAGNAISFTQAMTLDANGSLGIGSTSLTGFTLRLDKNITGSVNPQVFLAGGTIQTDATGVVVLIGTSLQTVASANSSNVYHYNTGLGSIGAGTVIGNLYGYVASGLTQGTSNFGFYGNIGAAANRWNLYMNGTANNYLAGNLGIGQGKTVPTAQLDISGSVLITGSLGVTGPITGSSILSTGTITAQTLVVTTISSSVVFSSGSNIFGNNIANTQTFTGSVNITGSLNLYGNQNITGSLNVSGSLTLASASLSYQHNLSLVTGSYQVIASAVTGSYRCAFFDYVMFSGSVVRAGTVTSTWSGSTTEYYENYTADLGGSTSGVQLQTTISAGNIQLQATASSPAWTIRSLIRLL